MKTFNLTIFLMILGIISPTLGRGAELRVPQEYTQVSSALAYAEPGDTILVEPGGYNEGMSPWLFPENVAVVGLGASPEDVIYNIERHSTYEAAVLLKSGCRVENMTLYSANSATLCLILPGAVDVKIKNVVLNIHEYYGIETPRDFAEAEISNVTFRKYGQPRLIPGGTGIWIYHDCSIWVRNCLFKDLDIGLANYSRAVIKEHHNCFDNVINPFYFDRELNPTDIVGATGVDEKPYGPPYGSILIDAGDPTLFDPDGTVSDIGAIPYNHTTHLIGFGDTIPERLPDDDPVIFRAGDIFALQSLFFKPRGHPVITEVESVDVYLFLDVYGDYWFWPDWSHGKPNCMTIDIKDGHYRHEEIFRFVWPVVDGSASGLRFWASTIKTTSADEYEFGPIACLEFGYE